MSTVICPEGHASQSTDYCDVCGTPIPAAGAGAGSAGSGAGAAASSAGAAAATADPGAAAGVAPTTPCPNCDSPAAAGALFCENCGYDFTTGSLPFAQAEPASAVTATSAAPSSASAGAPLAPTAIFPASSGGPEASPAAAVSPADPGTAGSAPAGQQPSALNIPPTPGPAEWVAELWIDPDWYASQAPEDPMPSAGLPVLVPLRERSVLIGRPSKSRGIHPQIDCGVDSSVSRRHCQLNTDGVRWWVEDLQSANGTYISPAGEALPTTPIIPGRRQELGDGDRIYVGGWTRIIVRKAMPGES